METILTEQDRIDLRKARTLLESPRLVARLTGLIGKPLEAGFRKLPAGWRDSLGEVTRKVLFQALEVAIGTLDVRERRPARARLHRLMVAASGAAGGVFGLASLPLELPLSTCIILRSVADIARSEGHDIGLIETKLACLEVLALGGEGEADHTAESTYWATRVCLAQAVSEAAAYLAGKGLVQEGAPPLVRLIMAIAPRFGITVSQQLAAKVIPAVGSLAGAAVNLLFLNHFQDMAHGHFTILRLEKKYGREVIETEYHRT